MFVTVAANSSQECVFTVVISFPFAISPIIPAVFISADAAEFEKFRSCNAIVFIQKLAFSDAQSAL